jgi:hypothetical protein
LHGRRLAVLLDGCTPLHLVGRQRRSIVIADIEDDVLSLVDELDRMSLRDDDRAAIGALLRLCRCRSTEAVKTMSMVMKAYLSIVVLRWVEG